MTKDANPVKAAQYTWSNGRTYFHPELTTGPTILGNVFVSQAEVDYAVANKASEPIKASYDAIIAAANIAVNAALQSVMDNVGVEDDCGTTDGHRFCTPNTSNRPDYDAAIAMSNNAVTLAQAYVLTSNTSYADRCVDIINHWCLDANEYMDADFLPAIAFTSDRS